MYVWQGSTCVPQLHAGTACEEEKERKEKKRQAKHMKRKHMTSTEKAGTACKEGTIAGDATTKQAKGAF